MANGRHRPAQRARRAWAGAEDEQRRSDCYVEVTERTQREVTIDVRSKVGSLYGRKIISVVADTCRALETNGIAVKVVDQGALPFVLRARTETAIRRLYADKAYALQPKVRRPGNRRIVKDHLRRSRLYLPGNNPKYFVNAGLYNADVLIYDLEDSVDSSEKDAARILVKHALCSLPWCDAERAVRINRGDQGLQDLHELALSGVEVVLVPKCESGKEIHEVRRGLERFNWKSDALPNILPILESPKGILAAYEIAASDPLICGLSFGIEDFLAETGISKSASGVETLVARSLLVLAARAAGIQVLDSVFGDVKDLEGLRVSAQAAKALGFDGKGCIHPAQIQTIHDAFAPTPTEIASAMKIVSAFEGSKRKGIALVSVGSKMIDPPVVQQALNVIDLAQKIGAVKRNWRRSMKKDTAVKANDGPSSE